MATHHHEFKIKVSIDGPYIVTGGVPLIDLIAGNRRAGPVHPMERGQTLPGSGEIRIVPLRAVRKTNRFVMARTASSSLKGKKPPAASR